MSLQTNQIGLTATNWLGTLLDRHFTIILIKELISSSVYFLYMSPSIAKFLAKAVSFGLIDATPACRIVSFLSKYNK